MIEPHLRNLGREQRSLEYYSAIFQISGAAFVLIGGFSAASLAYVPTQHDSLHWLLVVYVAPSIGTCLLTIAFALRAIAAGNKDLTARLYEWETAGVVRGSRPRIRLFTWQPRSWRWWGGQVLTLGALILDIGMLGRLAGELHTVHYTKVQNLILEKICIAAGGLVLFIGALCYIGKEVGWIVSKGTMFPPTWKDSKSITFWLNWNTYWGCMLYFMRGYMPIMYGHLKPRTFRLLSGMGYGVGSLLMMAGGVLMLVRVSKDAGEEDTAPLPHQKVHDDDFPAAEGIKEEENDVAALDTKLLAMAEVLGYSRDKLDKHIQSSRSMYMSPETVSSA